MEKKISNVTFFVTGDVAQNTPTRAFFTYDVETLKGAKTGNVHRVAELDATKTVAELWAEGVAEIKTLEGIV